MRPNSSNHKALKLLVLTLALTTVVRVSYAQGLGAEDEAILNADPMSAVQPGNVSAPQLDINGNYQVASEADKMKKQRADMERQTDDMLKKKTEEQRVASEKKINAQMAAMLSGQPAPQDEVKTAQSSVQKVEVTAAEIKPEAKVKNYKIIPYGGAQQMQGAGEVNFQAKVNTGLRAEATVLDERLGIGVGFNFAQTDVRDNRFVNAYSQYAQNGQNQNAPEFKYRNMSGELYGKFYLLNKSVFRPYVGAGVAYNSSKLTYSSQQNQYYSPNYGNNTSLNNGYSSSYASASGMAGTDFNFTESVGLNLEFKYSRALSSAFNSNDVGLQQFMGYDQAYLQQLGQQMNEAALMAVNFGLVIRF